MKKSTVALLPLVFVALSATAQEAPVRTSHVADALESAGRELNAYFSPRSNPARTLAEFNSFAYTPETTRKLVDVFGSSHPLIVQQLPASKGKLKFDMRMPAWHYTDTDGTSASADAMLLRFDLDQAGKRMITSGRLPALRIAGVTGIGSVRDVRLEGRQWHGAGDVWYGKMRMTAAGASIEVKPGNTTLAMTGIALAADVTPRGKLADLNYDAAVKSVSIAGQAIDDFHLGFRINRLDVNKFNEVAVEMQLHQAPDATPQQQLAEMKTMLHALARDAVAQGTTLDIADLSARFHGYTARLRGQFSLAGATEQDAGSLRILAGKIVAHIEISVPLALVKEVGNLIPAPPGDAPAGKSIADRMLGKLMDGGYARLDKGMLRSTIDYAGGALRVNGKPLALPPGDKAAPVPTLAPADAAQGN